MNKPIIYIEESFDMTDEKYQKIKEIMDKVFERNTLYRKIFVVSEAVSDFNRVFFGGIGVGEKNDKQGDGEVKSSSEEED